MGRRFGDKASGGLISSGSLTDETTEMLMKRHFIRFILILGIMVPLSMNLVQCSPQPAADVELNKQKNLDFLVENSKHADIQVTASGLQYQILAEGNGNRPGATDFVTVNYAGSLISGQVFDKGDGIRFPLNGVIPGWTEGLQLMQQGAKFRFYIPSALAYGNRGAGHVIPPDATLIFDVELVKIDRAV